MQEVIKTDDVKIEEMIYEIRGIQVMFDRDLAKLYHVETKELMQSVKRNIKRFPECFMFQLTKEEFLDWRSQFVTSKNDIIGLRRAPYAFTEHGVAMLSGLLRSDEAIKTNIAIISAFVKMRHFILENEDIYKSINNINNILTEHNEKIDYLFSKFDKKEQVLLKGQTFESYMNVLEILNNAHDEITIVDNYADVYLLDLIRSINCNIILITKNSDRLSNIEIDKFNMEYHNLTVIRNNDFHDRIIVIDNKDIYLLGSSVNSIGEKNTAIIELNNRLTKDTILRIINDIKKAFSD